MNFQRQFLLLTLSAGAINGCASIPAMRPANSDVATAASSAPPEFDVIPPTVAQSPGVPQTPAVAATPEL
jgi:hypothetical protein